MYNILCFKMEQSYVKKFLKNNPQIDIGTSDNSPNIYSFESIDQIGSNLNNELGTKLGDTANYEYAEDFDRAQQLLDQAKLNWSSKQANPTATTTSAENLGLGASVRETSTVQQTMSTAHSMPIEQQPPPVPQQTAQATVTTINSLNSHNPSPFQYLSYRVDMLCQNPTAMFRSQSQSQSTWSAQRPCPATEYGFKAERLP